MRSDLTGKLQAAGVNATGYAAKLPDGKKSVIILNKDAEKDLEVKLDFGHDAKGTIQFEALHAPALDGREAQITKLPKTVSLEQGTCSASVRHATGVRFTLT